MKNNGNLFAMVSDESRIFFNELQQGIPLSYFIPKTKHNFFFYKNGLSHIIPRLKVKAHTDINECYEIWENFTQKKSVFDEWEFRYAWYKGFENEPFFYTLYEGKNIVGSIPLWYNKSKNIYEWFGSDWMEDNKFFVKDHEYIDLLFKILPSPIYLGSFEYQTQWKNKNIFSEIVPDDPKNIKKLTEYSSIYDLLKSFNKKRRYNFKYDVKKIEKQKPRVSVIKGYNAECMKSLFKMNIERFKSDENHKSIFEDAKIRKTFEILVKKAKTYEAKFIKVEIGRKTAAIDLILEYKNTYCVPIGANNIAEFNGIGVFMMYKEFEEAIKNKFEFIDTLQEDYGWKHRYLDPSPLFKWQK